MAIFQRFRRLAAAGFFLAFNPLTAQAQEPPPRPDMAEICRGIADAGRVVCADIGALDQTLVYNRFGSFNPFGMIFALDRDLAVLRRDDGSDEAQAGLVTASDCAAMTGAEYGHAGADLSPGNVRLRDCKRPRPLVLRANVDDTLVIRVTNWLYQPQSPDFSRDFCKGRPTLDSNAESVRPELSRGARSLVRHGEATCPEPDTPEDEPEILSLPEAPDWPNTRGVNFLLQGLTPLPIDGDIHPGCIGSGSVAPGGSFLCKYKLQREGTYFFASQAAPAGGEGDGGSIVHGLFGALMVERKGTRAYRSQTSTAAFDAVWPRAGTGKRHARTEIIDYEKTLFDHLDAMNDPAADADDPNQRIPLLNLAMVLDRPAAGEMPVQDDFADATRLEIVHSDLNAIIYCDPKLVANDCRQDRQAPPATTQEPGYNAFREFSVFFHDELKTFYTKNFQELASLGQLAGVRDGFAINYGSSGMGSLLLANRKGIGPASECKECLYEEFFLTSWANGDPALLEWYADDPSNVHHSYLNDPVVFRNFHAGPKETHVFHLHAHQWFAGNDPGRGAYLDSQTVAPQQGFTYNIYHGGLRDLNGKDKGWWDTQGSGNRNRTVGDSIFHCHLYPHFAQGMWALWRVHDVLEDGTRKMPDGQVDASLSTEFPEAADRGHSRPGSVERLTGRWIGPEDGSDPDQSLGTPIPALIPLPGEPLPLLPTYASDADVDTSGATPVLKAEAKTPMPGFPFYIAGQPGHRPPQPPLDIARELTPPEGTDAADAIQDLLPQQQTSRAEIDTRVTGEGWLDGGLGRHVVMDGSAREPGFMLPERVGETLQPAAFDALSQDERGALTSQVVAKAFALGDLSEHLTSARIETLPNDGTRLERAAMGFHYNGRLYRADGLNGQLNLSDVRGSDLPEPDGGGDFDGSYATGHAQLPDQSDPEDRGRGLYVNGAPPKPGAPFADPCGTGRVGRAEGGGGKDPLYGPETNFWRDPLLIGYRRYEVSAVQLDMVVNRAGWHDPQARINVRTQESLRFKDQVLTTGAKPISPTVSDTEEPFFFRAISGECIEFRHTNELPKELALDDFQVKTPTDTIGQHIHLVKFDVTASDGSGNGWNYEDGTFAADELALRRCASAGLVTPVEDAPGVTLAPGECVGPEPALSDIWRRPLAENRDRFQTTVQRWFADPMLTLNGNSDDPKLRDRTLRTVFSHDHFGPSSIQQHGFYSALVIEPGVDANDLAYADLSGPPSDALKVELAEICTQNEGRCVAPLPDAAARYGNVAWGGEIWDGAKRKVKLQGENPAHPDYREFAISVADFALLYDPRDRSSEAELRRTSGLGANNALDAGDLAYAEQFGMGRIYCEAKWRRSPLILQQLCGASANKDLLRDAKPGDGLSTDSWYFGPEDVPPAWIAGGANRDDSHKDRYIGGDLFASATEPGREVQDLFDYMVSYRARAAGHPAAPPDRTVAALAKPVAPPARPEAISVDHHDPYLVNYRNAPLPLRIGDKEPRAPGMAQSDDCRLLGMGVPGRHAPEPDSPVVATLKAAAFGECSIDWQVAGTYGDMGGALLSGLHGDPETPVLEAYQNERMVIRMVQGAQEVQHTFNVAGLAFKRNIDQMFPSGRQLLGLSDQRMNNLSLRERCLRTGAGLEGRPDDYLRWRDREPDHAGHDPFWRDFETALAGCDNLEGLTFAQEIGISEHFEMNGSLRADIGISVEGAPLPQPVPQDQRVARNSSDYLYNFGSVDSLWNGAWGLMRIYGNDDAPDPATLASLNADNPHAPQDGLSAEGVSISDRLGIAPEGLPTESVGGAARALPMGTGGLVCPYPGENETQRVVEAVLAAVETAHVWDDAALRGTDYGLGRHDPDGLMLALLSPTAFFEQGLEADGWQGLTRAAVRAAVRAAYTNGPRPMTLRVRAGDCVRLRFVNALRDSDDGLRDELGDARLPPITPLNADPAPTAPEHGQSDGRLESVEAPMPPGGLRPSAQLGLSVALPGMDVLRDLPLAYGYGARALPPAAGDGVTVSNIFMFYAGRMRLDLPDEAAQTALLTGIGDAIAEAVATGPEPWLSDGTDIFPLPEQRGFLQLVPIADAADAVVQLLGVSYGVAVVPQDAADYPDNDLIQRLDEPAVPPVVDASEGGMEDLAALVCTAAPDCFDRATAQQRLLDLARPIAAEGLDARVHWVPYAFGAVPIRSTSDVIGHVQHGLFGAIDVVPASWRRDDAQGWQSGDENCTLQGRYEYCQVGFAEAPAEAGDGSPTLYLADPLPGAPPEAQSEQVREFVLYYQDGLNLWDEGSRISWRWDDDRRDPVEGLAGSALKMVPDCLVCDDSYDRGEQGVNYRSPAFAQGLSTNGLRVEASDDLNALTFAPDFWISHPNAIRLRACAGEQVVIRVVHPGGRARQRAFVMNGADYDDLFPGFGFPRSALLAPGKTISAWLTPRIEKGTYLWHDGPTTIRSGGVWGLLEVAGKEQCAYPF